MKRFSLFLFQTAAFYFMGLPTLFMAVLYWTYLVSQEQLTTLTLLFLCPFLFATMMFPMWVSYVVSLLYATEKEREVFKNVAWIVSVCLLVTMLYVA